MTAVRTVLILMLLAANLPAQGDLRLRLQHRLPEPRGVLEHYYTGDGWDFYSRVRFVRGRWGITLMTDKARGEDWGDLLAGGVSYLPGRGSLRSISAGWLRADLGTGLVLSVPGSFSDISELSIYKPPVSRDRIEPATSPWGCRGEPLTGAGGTFLLGNLCVSALASVSRIDSVGEGYHRTPTEIAGRGSIPEVLGAFRISLERTGLTAMAARRDRGEGYGWFRTGLDWSLEAGDLNLSGEAALGGDSSGTSAAGWSSLSLRTGSFRNMLMVIRNPGDFPDERRSPPVSRECDLGVCLGFRWRAGSGVVVRSGAGGYFREGEDLLLVSGQFEYRFPWSMEGVTGLRTRVDGDETAWRWWLGSSWKPHRFVSVSSRVQISGWRDSSPDSSESGSGLEIKLRYLPSEVFTVDLGGAACSTDGYQSRIYAGGSSFPGVFGVTALYGRTMAVFFQLSAEIGEGASLRFALSRRATENVESLGSGWEETEGASLTELGFQLDYALR
ncbi:MAG: hypothetical protein AVO35_06370 [Candidatus Aegiribacteria sp. MLS_C]|nr:MAG: hypothetical protein AVO35_06370 [Candidatus Aegiribacteria sp. MLS_C]